MKNTLKVVLVMFFQNDIFGNSVPREGIQLPFLFLIFIIVYRGAQLMSKNWCFRTFCDIIPEKVVL